MSANDEQLLYSTSCILMTFHVFSKLPYNLRALILSYAAPTLRTRFVKLYGFASPSFNPHIRYVPRLPQLFAVSRETRDFSIAHEGGTLAHLFATPKRENTFYFNFERDIIFLSSRFTPPGNFTETSRLRELRSLLKPAFLCQVRKIVVTYSSLDDFSESSIGGVFLNYDGLETLFVATCDWWSNKAVRTRLRQELPMEGYVKVKIEAKMRVAEGGETEDEDESAEEYEARTSGRAKRRVVECELRLGE
ncbi:hypothetical protein N0V91_006771 [Didymella pomorum]|jgi:hypothetical protein|uniref:2EXR domain-containing protein n=1 Tax=Didymella pomorum TaxID=749634 RepID=A0A9W8ZC92_9PLEO|nr:hypothetical protein N0V91_006771 [Didymella pomorum]